MRVSAERTCDFSRFNVRPVGVKNQDIAAVLANNSIYFIQRSGFEGIVGIQEQKIHIVIEKFFLCILHAVAS